MAKTSDERELRPNEINDNLGLDNILYRGDILLSPEQLDHLIAVEERNQRISGREKRQAIALGDNSYYEIFNKTKPIYYMFNESFSNTADRQLFREAANYLNAYTCLNITEGIGLNNSIFATDQIINIISAQGCYSTTVGYRRQNKLSLGPGCVYFSTMVHEIGHVLGFHHTQNRHDRDNYIRVTVNPSDPYANQYVKATEDENDNLGLPYDLGSVMHYASRYSGGTMETVDETKRYSIGATVNFAFSDFKMLNALYKCQESCPTGPICQNQGFRNPKNCNVCVCPRGFHGNDCTVPKFTEDTNQICGGLLHAQAYVQTFNGSMNSYTNASLTRPQLSTCYWHIVAPEGKAVRTKFNSFNGPVTSSPCNLYGLEVRTDTFETVGARVCLPAMINSTLEYKSSTNLSIVAAFTKNEKTINFSFSYWFVDQSPPPETTTATTTVDPRSFTPLNCSGAIDLVFVIDSSNQHLSAQTFEIVKSQIFAAIDDNGIKLNISNNDTARIVIVLSTGRSNPSPPFRFYDFQGCPYYKKDYHPSTDQLKMSIRAMQSRGGINDIARSMTVALKGNYNYEADSYYIFGDPLFEGPYDRRNVPNAMIVISSFDNSNVTQISNELKLSGVQVFSIGFEDMPISQLQAISGDSATAFYTYPENISNIIKEICTGV